MRRLKIILYFSFHPSLFLLSFLPRPIHQTQSPFDSSPKYVLSLSFFLIKFLVISTELEAVFCAWGFSSMLFLISNPKSVWSIIRRMFCGNERSNLAPDFPVSWPGTFSSYTAPTLYSLLFHQLSRWFHVSLPLHKLLPLPHMFLAVHCLPGQWIAEQLVAELTSLWNFLLHPCLCADFAGE